MKDKETASDSDIVKVKDTYYKPFWFDHFMYFVDLKTGTLYRNRPIYIQDRDYASMSDLRNYFSNNDIQILNTEDAIQFAV